MVGTRWAISRAGTGTQDLDLGRLAEIHRQVKLRLLLHGGTGISAYSLRQAISLGVAKVNYGSYLKQSYLTLSVDHRVASGKYAAEFLGAIVRELECL